MNPTSLRILLLVPLALAIGGERVVSTYTLPHQVQTFQVKVIKVTGQKPEAMGDHQDRPIPFPSGTVDFDVEVVALDTNGERLDTYDQEVSFRVTPGHVLDVRTNGKTTGNRMLKLEKGFGRGTLTAEKVFGRTVVWVHDSPPPPSFKFAADYNEDVEPTPDAGTGNDGGPDTASDAPDRTYAAGVSAPVFFKDPSIADVQRITIGESFGNPAWDNKTSPLVGNFLTIERPPPAGDMIVTGIGAEGFYVTDLKAEPFHYDVRGSSVKAVGNFASIFVYSYSYPDGLFLGDRVKTISGTVQEFSGHTQLVFPSWVRVEATPRPQDIPAPVLFDFSETGAAGYRLCKANPSRPTQLDILCGYSNNNVEMETVESSLVKIINARPSNDFVNCDSNGNAQVPPFRYIVPEVDGVADFDNARFGCDPSADFQDCECNRDCITSIGPHTGKICSELSNFRNYGQWVVMLDQASKTRINVITRDALPRFDPTVFARPEYEGCTVDITGMLRQVQAARPRWAIVARDRSDVCCRAPEGKSCPDGIPVCPKPEQ
ncbi:MAG: hypothetical protein ACK4N5_01385 [Myxococcales bacterium]